MKIIDIGDQHFTDLPDDPNDKRLADEISEVIGDLFVSSNEDSPFEIWTQVVKALRVHGLEIKDKK
jgi:hypothetical protein